MHSKLYENESNGAGYEVSHSNQTGEKLKEQGAKTGSSSTNKSTSGLSSSALFDDALITRQKSPNNLPTLQTAFTCYASHFWPLVWLFPRILSHRLSGLWRPILAPNAFERLRYSAGAGVGQPVSTSSLLSCRSGGRPLRHPRQLRLISPLLSRLFLYFHMLVIL